MRVAGIRYSACVPVRWGAGGCNERIPAEGEIISAQFVSSRVRCDILRLKQTDCRAACYKLHPRFRPVSTVPGNKFYQDDVRRNLTFAGVPSSWRAGWADRVFV